MDFKTRVQIAARQYLADFSGEFRRTEHFLQFLENTPDAQLVNRKYFIGHITASAFIVSADGSQMLLLHHKSLEKWLQPGGHVDPTDASLLAAALREVAEETGIEATDLQHISLHPEADDLPMDIDSHFIPENPRKQEAAHFHHDFRFLFRHSGRAGVKLDETESTGFRWVKFEMLWGDADFGGLVEKLQNLICAPNTDAT